VKPAFIIIDLQVDFFREDPLKSIGGKLVPAVNALAGFARENGYPVIWVRQEFEPDLSDAFLNMRRTGTRMTIRGTEGVELLPGLVVDKTDYDVKKKRYSAFFETNLAGILESLKIDTLVIGGINTHACVRAAVVDGYQRDYDIYIVEDCCGSWDPAHHEITLEYLDTRLGKVIDSEGIRALFHGNGSRAREEKRP